MKVIIELKIKKKLYEACLLFVNEKQNTVTTTIESNKKALFSETKSSAGDKHETGRAMLQLEMEKASQQLAVINQMKAVLDKIIIENTSTISCLGSLIITNKGTYYLVNPEKAQFRFNLSNISKGIERFFIRGFNFEFQNYANNRSL